MSTATFDTHAAVRAMEKAGLAAPQAEAITDTIRAAVSEGVATKSDIAELRADMASLETRMTRTLYGVAAALLAGQLAAVVALLRLLG